MYRHRALLDHLPGEVPPACRVQNGPVEEYRDLRLSSARPPSRTSSKLESDERDVELHVRCAVRNRSSGVELPPKVDRGTSCTATSVSAKRGVQNVLRRARACRRRSKHGGPRSVARIRSRRRHGESGSGASPKDALSSSQSTSPRACRGREDGCGQRGTRREQRMPLINSPGHSVAGRRGRRRRRPRC